MSSDRPEPDPTRKLLKIFGVTVTEYQARTRQLLEQGAVASTTEEVERVMREAAELSGELNRCLREVTNHVLQLQSDFLMELVAREHSGDQPKGEI
jgi:hypothetical protein